MKAKFSFLVVVSKATVTHKKKIFLVYKQSFLSIQRTSRFLHPCFWVDNVL